jgi:DNA-binding transcriptional MerR regulator
VNDIKKELTKRYYTIGEVADMFNVSKSLVRFWEQEFVVLKPHKNRKGERLFTPKNIAQFELIYHLVKERGFTLNGAKREIKARRQLQKQKEKILKKLKQVKRGLEDLREEV